MTSRRQVLTILAGCVAMSATPAQAQQAALSAPPQVLKIEREWVKPGKTAGHEKVEAEFPKAAARAKDQWNWLAMESETGPGQLWAMIALRSFDDWQKSEDTLGSNTTFNAAIDELNDRDANFRLRDDTLAAVYDESLSYRPDADWGKMRFFLVTTFQIRAGHDPDFLEIDRLTREAHVKAKIDEHWVVYRIISGAPTGTYLVFAPMRSMKELDESDARHKPYLDALGEQGQTRLHELEAIAYERESEDVFAVNPKLSYVSKEWTASDPEFWNPKPAAARPAPNSKKKSATPAKP